MASKNIMKNDIYNIYFQLYDIDSAHVFEYLFETIKLNSQQ